MAEGFAPVAITAWQCVTSAGCGVGSLRAALSANVPCLAPIGLFPLPYETVVGEYAGELPAIAPELSAYACRNARLALLALNTGDFRARLREAAARHGRDRVAVILGTSTSGIYDSERAYSHFLAQGKMPPDFDFLHQHAIQATAGFLALELGLKGPVYAISTACSSSAKALGSAQRMLLSGVCGAAVVAGVDTLCRLTLRGFHSLELVSATPCRPMDAEREGISIGEAAALLLLENAGPDNRHSPRLLAVGESSDAHHMSAPEPQGRGAEAAMRAALRLAGLDAGDVGYVSLHATATRLNDLAEARAVARVVGQAPCSGVKGIFGHTLGASGALETIVTLEALRGGELPGTCGLRRPDPECPVEVLRRPEAGDVRFALCNAFGFGGSNASVLLARSGADLKSGLAPAGRRFHGRKTVSLRGHAVCATGLALPPDCTFEIEAPDSGRLPAAIRRRTSQATRLALCAGLSACERAGVDPVEIPAVFASVGGEMQVTDQLCIELAKPDGWISPTRFHNSVHNTAAGYWSIATGSTRATTAMGAAGETVAMAWLEACCRMMTENSRILLVCYDERWPAYLQPGMGTFPVAVAMVLEGGGGGTGPSWRDPEAAMPAGLARLVRQTPVLAALSLLKRWARAGTVTVAPGEERGMKPEGVE